MNTKKVNAAVVPQISESNIKLNFLEDFTIGQTKDLKFGLITREVYRALKNLFVIDDTSHGWTSAEVDQQTLESLISGNLSILDIDFI